MVDQLRRFAARVVTGLALVALLTGAFPSSSRYPAFLPPQIGGVLPSIFADFTTEGTSNHYWYLGKQYSGEAAWCTAIGCTFSRPSSAYYTNSSGNLVQAGNNVLRFDYDPVSLIPKGILLETGTTNLALQSNTFSNATWSTSGGLTVAQNVTGPDGVSNSAWTLTDGVTNATHGLFQTISVSSGQSYTASLYVKFTNHQYIFLRMNDGVLSPYITYDLINGIITNVQALASASGTIKRLANGWFFITATFTATNSTSSTNPFFGFANSATYTGGAFAGTGTDTFLAWGAQFEAFPFATSYVPTTTGTANRNPDRFSATPISSWYNTTNGVFYASGDSGAFDTQRGFGSIFNSGSGSNRIDLRNGAAGGANQLGLVQTTASGGSNFIPVATDTGQQGYFANVRASAAFSVAVGNVIYVKDGGIADTSSALTAMPSGPDTIEFGDLEAGDRQPFGHINQIGYWPTTASAGQLQTLTAPPSWVPTAVGSMPTLFADFAGQNYLFNGYVQPSLAAWESQFGATFARSSSATFVGSNGLIQTASSNVPRFDYDPIALTPKGLLMEGASTNLVQQSGAVSTSPWTLDGVSATGGQSDPFGGNGAFLITGVSGDLRDLWNSAAAGTPLNMTGGLPYAWSWFVKPGTDTAIVFGEGNGLAASAAITYNPSTQAFSNVGALITNPTVTLYQNGWQKVSYVLTPLSNHTNTDPIIIMSGVGQTVVLAALQIEQLGFASSYIPTTSSNVARQADLLSGAVPPGFTQFPGTLLANAALIGTGVQFDVFGFIGTAGAGAGGGMAYLRIDHSVPTDDIVFGTQGVSSSDFQVGTYTGGFQKWAGTWNTNSVAGSANGAAALSGTPTVTPSSLLAITTIPFEAFTGPTYYDLKTAGFWNGIQATNSQLQGLSTP